MLDFRWKPPDPSIVPSLSLGECTVEDESAVSVIQTEGSIRRGSKDTSVINSRCRSMINSFNLTRSRLNFALSSSVPAVNFDDKANVDEIMRRYSYHSLASTLRLSMFSLVRESASLRQMLPLTYHHRRPNHPPLRVNLQAQAIDLKRVLEKVVGLSYKLNEMSQGLEEAWGAVTEVRSTQIHTQGDLLTKVNDHLQRKIRDSQCSTDEQSNKKHCRLVYKTRFLAETVRSLLVYIRPKEFDGELVAILERASRAASVKYPK
ncbi:hypothetical protein AAG570_000704 [Ranatra chinensis]|uniref:Uncharacterized protein n=1 Tax=Ranatra chinensis TaxID=642074 RepID=A0ABD0ZL43_9HEMI